MCNKVTTKKFNGNCVLQTGRRRSLLLTSGWSYGVIKMLLAAFKSFPSPLQRLDACSLACRPEIHTPPNVERDMIFLPNARDVFLIFSRVLLCGWLYASR